ncbi:hypothetical protein [Marivita sp.]|uniref:hypothetical protein n=1 Tax=Marivita sp. TaxID=2003365 RepID=UPI0025C01C6F|nr:hypothetical protein [Marivita sp.]
MKLESQVVTASEPFKTDRAAHLDALRVVEDAADLAIAGGGSRAGGDGAERA